MVAREEDVDEEGGLAPEDAVDTSATETTDTAEESGDNDQSAEE
jgi:hypothetical protein